MGEDRGPRGPAHPVHPGERPGGVVEGINAETFVNEASVGIGIRGTSKENIGVKGDSINDTGVRGESQSGIGVTAKGGHARYTSGIPSSDVVGYIMRSGRTCRRPTPFSPSGPDTRVWAKAARDWYACYPLLEERNGVCVSLSPTSSLMKQSPNAQGMVSAACLCIVTIPSLRVRSVQSP